MQGAAMAREYDVWVQSSNTIYKRVPFNIVTDWAEQGRLAKIDKLRPAGSNDPWLAVLDDPIIADFLFSKPPEAAPTVTAPAAMDVVWGRPAEDEDDDVDMIPLIDISLVLLIFFMMTAAVSALSPVDVPQMKNAFNSAGGDAWTVTIDKRPNSDPTWSLRLGDKPPEAGDDDLDSLAQLLVRLDDRLKAANTAPEVRFACHRDLPSDRVHELVKELEIRKKANKISAYHAEVNEKK
jgi:biopolymer transport protein ExbD